MEKITSSKELLKGIQELALLSIEDLKSQLEDVESQIKKMVFEGTAMKEPEIDVDEFTRYISPFRTMPTPDFERYLSEQERLKTLIKLITPLTEVEI